VTSILLLWAALIKSTRIWGGELSQGRAFGILDGGRGLVAAAFASAAVIVFGSFIASGGPGITPEERFAALIGVIYFYTAVTFLTGLITWWCVPRDGMPATPRGEKPWRNVDKVLRERVVWVQALIVVCAYCGYKGLDNYSLYAVDVLAMSEVEAARFTANCAYLRPLAAVAAGLLADRLSARRMILSLFILLACSYSYLGGLFPLGQAREVLFGNIFLSFAAVYALRGIYFALLQETRVAAGITGTAVGLISFVGFTPDIFFAAIGGRLIDSAPGVTGHQYYFLMLGAIMVAGACAAFAIMRGLRGSLVADSAIGGREA
jgi:nitrate/nitrite transporter NarK